MYKTFFIILAVLLLAATALMATFAPKMHKSIFLYDSGLQIALQKTENVQTKVTQTKINTVKQQLKPQKTLVAVNDNIVDTAVNIVNTPQKLSPKAVNIEQQPANIQQQKQTTKSSAPQTTKSKQQPAKTIPQPAGKKVTQTETKQEVKKQTAQSVKTAAQKEQEELILWNKWRSDLQNRIMQDVKLPIVQQGTVFRFAFDVDKYGKITNISTWSDNAMYTPYAIQYIAPVIRSYQGRDFMNFPTGSNRVTTRVEGAWKIADKTTYSTPADFKDVEKIRN